MANNSLPPPPRADRRKSNIPKGSGAIKSEKQRSLAHRDPKSSFEARHPYPPDSSRRPSAPATYYNGPFPTSSSGKDENLNGTLQLNDVPPMLIRGHPVQTSMKRPTQPTPPEAYSDTFYPPSTKPAHSNVPLLSSRSLKRANEWDPNPVYGTHAFKNRQRSNSFSSPISMGRNPSDPDSLPISPPEPQIHAAKADKILGISVSNVGSLQSGYTEQKAPRGLYGAAEHGVQWARNSKANKQLAFAPDEGTTFAPPLRYHSSGQSSHTVVDPSLRGASDLGRVHSNSSDRARSGSAGSVQEIEDYGRWRRESFMDFGPSVPSHQKSKSHPEALYRPPDSASSLRTVFSMVSTDSDIPVFSKRRPESIGKSQPKTTLKAFKELIRKTDGKMKYEQAEYGWEKVGAQEADFDSWGWGASSSAQERKPSEWAEAHTLPDEDREEQTTPKQTAQDLSPAESAPANALDQEERLAVIRRRRKIAQLLGMDIPPHTLGPVVQDETPTERRESWEPLNNQGTIYLDTHSNVTERGRYEDRSGSFVPKDKEQSSLASSILATNDDVDEFGMGMDMDMKGPDSPTSFMELSDEELHPHKGKARHFPLSRRFNEITAVEPPTPIKDPTGHSILRSDRTFSSSRPDSQTIKRKPSFFTEILEDSDWEAKERKKKRDKLAKMHRFLGSRVPAELVLGCSSGTIPPTALLLEEDEGATGRGKGGHGPNVGWNNERDMRNLGTMGGSEKMVQIKRAQKIEKVCSGDFRGKSSKANNSQMFGEQPPSVLLRPGACTQAPSTRRPSWSPPSRSAYAPSSHSAFRPGVPYPPPSSGPTPFATNITHNINSLYRDLPSNDKKYKNNHKDKDKFVPSLPPVLTVNKTNSDSPPISSSSRTTPGVSNDFKEQDHGWKGNGRLATSPKDMTLPTDSPSGPLHKGPLYNTFTTNPLSHSAQFVHYRNSFKSLAMIIDLVGSLPIWDRELNPLLLTGRQASA